MLKISSAEAAEAFAKRAIEMRAQHTEAIEFIQNTAEKYWRSARDISNARIRPSAIDSLNLASDDLEGKVKYSTTIAFPFKGEQQTSSLQELEDGLYYYDRDITRLTQLAQNHTNQIKTGKLGSLLSARENKYHREEAQKASQLVTPIEQDRAIFEAARQALLGQIKDKKTDIRAQAAEDTLVLKNHLHNAPTAEDCQSAETISAVLVRETEKKNMRDIILSAHPSDMPLTEIRDISRHLSEVISAASYRYKEEKLRENGERVFGELLNCHSQETMGTMLSRGTPFRGEIHTPHPFYFANAVSVPYVAEIRYRLIDPAIQDENEQPISLLEGQLRWNRERKILTIDHIWTNPKVESLDIARVAVRNIVDFAHSLQAQRVDLSTARTDATLLAKAGAQLQLTSGDVLLQSGNYGFGYGQDLMGQRIEYALQTIKEKGVINADEQALIQALAASSQSERALWIMGDMKTSDGETALDKFISARGRVYAMRFDLTSSANPASLARRNAYLATDLEVDTQQYELLRNKAFGIKDYGVFRPLYVPDVSGINATLERT